MAPIIARAGELELAKVSDFVTPARTGRGQAARRAARWPRRRGAQRVHEDGAVPGPPLTACAPPLNCACQESSTAPSSSRPPARCRAGLVGHRQRPGAQGAGPDRPSARANLARVAQSIDSALTIVRCPAGPMLKWEGAGADASCGHVGCAGGSPIDHQHHPHRHPSPLHAPRTSPTPDNRVFARLSCPPVICPRWT